MRVAYIAGPYRSKTINGVHDNNEAARKAGIEFWRNGFAVIVPHCNTAYFDGSCEDHVWLDGDLEILSRCDVVVMLPTWQQSEGAKAEHGFAVKLGEEIVYL